MLPILPAINTVPVPAKVRPLIPARMVLIVRLLPAPSGSTVMVGAAPLKVRTFAELPLLLRNQFAPVSGSVSPENQIADRARRIELDIAAEHHIEGIEESRAACAIGDHTTAPVE